MATTLLEFDRLAKELFGKTARVVPFRADGKWFAFAVDGRIIGCRRELSELPQLFQRGAYRIQDRGGKLAEVR